MSLWRQKAKTIEEEGAATRRNWNPAADSAHYRAYRWWLAQSGKSIPQENFCHYWRVVFVWAPLRWLSQPLRKRRVQQAIVSTVVGVLILCVLVVITMFFIQVPKLLLGLAGVGYVLFSLWMVLQVSDWLGGAGDTAPPWIAKIHPIVRWAMVVAALPMLVVAALIMVAIDFIVTAAKWIGEHSLHTRFWRWFTESHPPKLPWLRPYGVIVAVSLGTPAVLSPWYSWAWNITSTVLGAFTGMVVVVVAIMLISWAVDNLRERRLAHQQAEEVLRREAAMEADRQFLLEIFNRLHPEAVNNEEQFNNWLLEYNERCRHEWNSDWWQLHWSDHLSLAGANLTEEQREEVRQLFFYTAPQEVKRRSVFWHGVGDFFQLVWMVVLTYKWKTCPLVELPEEA